MSLMYYKQDETTPLLLKKEKKGMKRNDKLLKRYFIAISIGVSILGAIHLLLFSSNTKIQPEFNDDTKQTNSLHISSIATTNDDYFKKCAPLVNCYSNSKYRSLNGSCNNLKTPTWGAAETPFLRMLDADYSDGNYRFRLQSNGSELPSARSLTAELFLNREVYRVDENNVLLSLFAQLLAVDVSGVSTDVLKNEHGEIIDCCNDENAKKTYLQCQDVVENTSNDPVYSKYNKFCLKTLRYPTSINYGCPLNPSTYININTHFIDASEIYGSNDDNSLRLRLMEGGRLKFSVSRNGQMFCPIVVENSRKINSIDNNYSDDIQFYTGKNKGNQNVGITLMQTLFLRFHNYIAFTLSSMNPHWSDEILYQESRRIIIATIQRIAYEDFLPIIIGDDFQEVYGLNEENIYDPNTNPSTSLELYGAALRVLHTIIPVQFNLMDENYKVIDSIAITDWLTKSNLLLLDNNFDELLKGVLETPGRISQPSYNFYISNYMYNNFKKPRYVGRDLLSDDIVSGRDIGLQSYNQVRNVCGLHMANDFKDLKDFIRIKDINRLKKLYHSVNDIDLMVGLLLEKHAEGAIVGPTARCLIADGFFRFKAGDRYFYDTQNQSGSFTPKQLRVIKKITLGHVICGISNVDHVQKDIFKAIDHNLFPTFKLKCNDEFSIDLDEWEEPKL